MHPSSQTDVDMDIASAAGSETTPSSNNEAPPKTRGEELTIAKEENQNVFRLRLLVIAVLVASTIGVAVAVYHYVSNAEQESFEENFADDSDKVLEAIGSAMDLSLSAVDAFLVGAVSYARYTNSTWPFVTLPDYAVRVAKLQSLSKAVLVTQYHLVTGEERTDWEKYSVANDGWVDEGIEVQKTDETFHGKIVTDYWTRGDIHNNGDPYDAPGPYLPKWQQAPIIPIYAPYNWDAMTFPSLANALHIVQDDRMIAIGDVSNIPYPNNPESERQAVENSLFMKDFIEEGEDETEPFSDLYFPMLDYAADYVTIPKDSSSTELGKFVGVFAMTFFWRDLIKDILPADSNGIVVVFENSCGQTFTYQVNGPETNYLGRGDLHETKYDELEKTSPLVELDAFAIRDRSYTGPSLSGKGCPYTLKAYPSSKMEATYKSTDPIVFTLVAIAIFAFTSAVFIGYDYMVERRQQKVMKTAVHSNAIVSSLFPSTVRDRLFPIDGEGKGKMEHNKTRLKTFLSDGKQADSRSMREAIDDRPIADLFPHCTVLFSDISGFTAWSSERQPAQVFTLLEALYGAFDSIAMKRGVFKVETIGDAYVAVVGLPEPKQDHAVVMAKFARDCLVKMLELVKHLEKSLGPGTADLRLRFGLHSGAVTAGVLRGQKSRFQLFGDTVNTASRMESTSIPNRIQATSTTAELLIASGKASWVEKRDELVEAKGKGLMQTYWIEPKYMGHTTGTMSDESITLSVGSIDEKTRRLVEWSTVVLSRLLKQIVATRKDRKSYSTNIASPDCVRSSQGATVLDEVKEIIELPQYDHESYSQRDHPDNIELKEDVSAQLYRYVVDIAELYNDNSFHNFDHASHVGMSAAKLLSRIVSPEEVLTENVARTTAEMGSSLHDHTFGITTDSLTQFACVFSALIHDVDHHGVPNSRLVQEASPLATQYKSKSIAEQNSIDLAWNLLMKDEYAALRNAICPTEDDLRRFRQLVVNIVMATDIMDKDLKNLRNARWEKAFSDSYDEPLKASMDRKATIVLEHLIQASDVAHTMQHWHIYVKWNERLFEELYMAYQSGRASKDPSEFWYKGELAFFDAYILPLAGKLRDCGVFGVSSDEYYLYAVKNRAEWEHRGREVVVQMTEKCRKKHPVLK